MKVIKIDDGLLFDDGTTLSSHHSQDCCENHYLDFSNLKMDDFEGLDFDLNGYFFNRIEDFGIALTPTNGYPVRIPGYGYNNGYYSSNLNLVLSGTINRDFDISDCQVIS